MLSNPAIIGPSASHIYMKARAATTATTPTAMTNSKASTGSVASPGIVSVSPVQLATLVKTLTNDVRPAWFPHRSEREFLQDKMSLSLPTEIARQSPHPGFNVKAARPVISWG
jgi:hypothetical protein